MTIDAFIRASNPMLIPWESTHWDEFYTDIIKACKIN